MSNEKNKELGRKELLDKVNWWRKIAHIGGGCKDRDNCEQAYEQICQLIQQSGEKPEIDDGYIDVKARGLLTLIYAALQFEPHLETHRIAQAKIKDFIRQIVAEAQTLNISAEDTIDNIIDAVLEHIDCYHCHHSDGTSVECNIDDEKKLKEKLTKILG